MNTLAGDKVPPIVDPWNPDRVVWSFNTYYGASGYRYTIIRNGQPVRVSQKAYCTSRMAAAAARRALNR